MKKDILIVTGSLRRGGAERVISILSNELVKRGWTVHICTMLFSAIGYNLDPRIDIIDLSRENKNQNIDTPRMIKSLRDTIKNLKPDAVVSFMLTINIVTWMATRGLRVRFIPSERNDPSTGRGKLKHWLSCKAYASSFKTVFQTERARSFYSKKIQQNGVVIPNPVNVDQERNSNPKHKIVSVGRLEIQKNRRLLIDAFSDVYKKHPEYTLDIYGEGSQEEELKQLIVELGLTSAVILHGNVNDVHRQIADAEMFVLSSDYEGLSNALLEAMMMGLPCITTDCAGAAEAVEDGVDGIIIPIRDRKKMAEAMEELISDASLRNQFSKKAVEHSKRFKTDRVVDKWEELLLQ